MLMKLEDLPPSFLAANRQALESQGIQIPGDLLPSTRTPPPPSYLQSLRLSNHKAFKFQVIFFPPPHPPHPFFMPPVAAGMHASGPGPLPPLLFLPKNGTCPHKNGQKTPNTHHK